jgi:hypothetical protein
MVIFYTGIDIQGHMQNYKTIKVAKKNLKGRKECSADKRTAIQMSGGDRKHIIQNTIRNLRD